MIFAFPSEHRNQSILYKPLLHNTMEDRTTSNVLTGVIVVLVIALVAWLAYTRGFFSGSAAPADTQNNAGNTLDVRVNGPDADTGTQGGTGNGSTQY